MKLPVLYNSNFQIQDKEGVIVCDLFRNPKAEEDGARLAALINLTPGDVLEIRGVEVTLMPLGQSGRCSSSLEPQAPAPNVEPPVESDLTIPCPRVGPSKAERKKARSEKMKAIWAAKKAAKIAA